MRVVIVLMLASLVVGTNSNDCESSYDGCVRSVHNNKFVGFLSNSYYRIFDRNMCRDVVVFCTNLKNYTAKNEL